MNLPVIDPAATGKRINDLRLSHGMSVSDMKDYFGFATTYAIYKWMHGNALPTVENLLGLSMLFGVTVNDILVYH